MKVKWNPKTSLPEFIFEKTDYAAAAQIEEMISGQFTCKKCGNHNTNNAWPILEGYFRSARESVIESMKIGLRNRATRALTDIKAAKLEGFDEATRIPHKVIMQAEIMKINENKLEEIKNAAQSDSDDE